MVDFYKCREKMIKIKSIINSVVDQDGTEMFEVSWMNTWLSREDLEEISEEASVLITEFTNQLQQQQSEERFQGNGSLILSPCREGSNGASDQQSLVKKSSDHHLPHDGLTLVKEESMTEDFEDCEGTLFMCDVCNVVYSSHKSLSEHKRHCTSENQIELSYSSIGGRNSPVKSVTTTTQYSHCLQTTRARHVVTSACSDRTGQHDDHTTNKCLQNRLHHNDVTNKPMHGNGVTTDVIYECENCHMTFADEEYLARHMVRCKNQAEAHFRCDICHRGFTTKGSLELHVDAIHLKKKDFGCSLCGKLFSRKHILKVHLATHYGKREFECATCGKTFLQKGNLNRHERIHQAKNFGYKCRYCGQAFTQNKHLQKHLTSQHGQCFNQDQ